MIAKKSDIPEGAIIGRASSRVKLSRASLLKLAIGAVVLAGLVLGGNMYLKNRERAQDAEFISLTKSVNTLTFQKQYDQAIMQLKDYIDRAPNERYKAETMVQLGSVYLNYGKYQEALSVFQEADRIEGINDLASAVGMALAAERLGDKTVAIEAYKKAIELLRPRDKEMFVAEDIKHYEAKIKALESQP